MKITRLKCEKIAQTSASVANKSFITGCKGIVLLHNNPDTPTNYLFILSQSFKDGTAPLLVIGDLTSAWVKFARNLKTKNSKSLIFGQCYAKTLADGSIQICLVNKTGAAKLTDICKDADVKVLLKKAKVGVAWASGMSDDTPETKDLEVNLGADTLDDEEDDTVADYTEEDGGEPNTAWEDFAEEAYMIKTLLESTAKTDNPVLKQKNKKELNILIPKFLEGMSLVKGIPPAKLSDFNLYLDALWKRNKDKKTDSPPQELVKEQIKKIFDLFKSLKNIGK